MFVIIIASWFPDFFQRVKHIHIKININIWINIS